MREFIKYILGRSIDSCRVILIRFRQFRCGLMGHDWTSAAMRGIPPTKYQLKNLAGFFDYAKMYCDKCGYESHLNNRYQDIKEDYDTLLGKR